MSSNGRSNASQPPRRNTVGGMGLRERFQAKRDSLGQSPSGGTRVDSFGRTATPNSDKSDVSVSSVASPVVDAHRGQSLQRQGGSGIPVARLSVRGEAARTRRSKSAADVGFWGTSSDAEGDQSRVSGSILGTLFQSPRRSASSELAREILEGHAMLVRTGSQGSETLDFAPLEPTSPAHLAPRISTFAAGQGADECPVEEFGLTPEEPLEMWNMYRGAGQTASTSADAEEGFAEERKRSWESTQGASSDGARGNPRRGPEVEMGPSADEPLEMWNMFGSSSSDVEGGSSGALEPSPASSNSVPTPDTDYDPVEPVASSTAGLNPKEVISGIGITAAMVAGHVVPRTTETEFDSQLQLVEETIAKSETALRGSEEVARSVMPIKGSMYEQPISPRVSTPQCSDTEDCCSTDRLSMWTRHRDSDMVAEASDGTLNNLSVASGHESPGLSENSDHCLCDDDGGAGTEAELMEGASDAKERGCGPLPEQGTAEAASGSQEKSAPRVPSEEESREMFIHHRVSNGTTSGTETKVAEIDSPNANEGKEINKDTPGHRACTEEMHADSPEHGGGEGIASNAAAREASFQPAGISSDVPPTTSPQHPLAQHWNPSPSFASAQREPKVKQDTKGSKPHSNAGEETSSQDEPPPAVQLLQQKPPLWRGAGAMGQTRAAAADASLADQDALYDRSGESVLRIVKDRSMEEQTAYTAGPPDIVPHGANDSAVLQPMDSGPSSKGGEWDTCGALWRLSARCSSDATPPGPDNASDELLCFSAHGSSRAARSDSLELSLMETGLRRLSEEGGSVDLGGNTHQRHASSSVMEGLGGSMDEGSRGEAGGVAGEKQTRTDKSPREGAASVPESIQVLAARARQALLQALDERPGTRHREELVKMVSSGEMTAASLDGSGQTPKAAAATHVRHANQRVHEGLADAASSDRLEAMNLANMGGFIEGGAKRGVKFQQTWGGHRSSDRCEKDPQQDAPMLGPFMGTTRMQSPCSGAGSEVRQSGQATRRREHRMSCPAIANASISLEEAYESLHRGGSVMTPRFWMTEGQGEAAERSREFGSTANCAHLGTYFADFTFKPRINNKSEKLAAAVYERTKSLGRSPGEARLEYLYMVGKKRAGEREDARQSRHDMLVKRELAQHCTFAPKMQRVPESVKKVHAKSLQN
eukprot:evm.model.scf_972.6 EVM.evm.TU.scf_972.6   scf_972:38392-42958(-)